MKKVISYLMIMVAFIFVSEIQAKNLRVQDASGAAGDVVTVAVVIDDATDLLSADITLTYDSGLLILKEAKKANLTSNFIIAYNAQGGEISIAIATAQALPGGSGSIVEVSFQIDAAAPLGAETFISIPRATLYNGTYQSMETTLQEGKVTVPCYSISPAGNTFGPQGGSGSVNVTAGPNCSWTAFPTSGSEGWIGISSGASGTGNGTVSYSVSANASTSTRTGTLTIAGQTFTVTQSGVACTYSISPTSRSHGPGAETGTVGVTALTGCNWTAVSNPTWITITSGASGSGTGTVGYSVAANASTSTRTGTLTLAGQTFTVTQDGAPCTYSISHTSRSHGPGAETGTVGVTALTGCNWTAVSNPTWVTITSGASGSGTGTVGYSVSANASTSTRTGTLTLAGQTFTVTQDGAPCTYLISPTDRSHRPGAETGTVAVTTPTGCNWTAVSNPTWVTITSAASGSGNGIVGYSVSPNGSASPRSGTLTIAGQTFTVTQGGSLFPILLTSPSDQALLDACSLYSLPTFAWSTTQTFKSYEIQFSSSDAFSLISVKVKTSTMRVQISSSTWKKILLIPGVTGGSVYWRVVGSRADKTQATSNVSSILIEGAHEVENPQISSTSKGPLPTLSWINHCNMKFKVWFGKDRPFSKKMSLSFSLKISPQSFTQALTSSQWGSIRKLVGEVTGGTIYWYVESWDGLGRYAKTDVMSFVLTD